MFEISKDTAKNINSVKKKGGKIIAVGTTVLRALESSIDKHHQFVHRLFGDHSTRGTQSMWVISSQIIPCISSTNYHSGINWDENMYSVSLSGYFRLLKDLFHYPEV